VALPGESVATWKRRRSQARRRRPKGGGAPRRGDGDPKAAARRQRSGPKEAAVLPDLQATSWKRRCCGDAVGRAGKGGGGCIWDTWWGEVPTLLRVRKRRMTAGDGRGVFAKITAHGGGQAGVKMQNVLRSLESSRMWIKRLLWEFAKFA
jgi:hypothetical protein